MHTEDAWERFAEYVALDRETLAEMVRPAFPGRDVRAASLLTGGKCNTSYRLEIAGESRPYVLRVYVRDRDACTREALLFARVADRVPVPRVVHHDPAGPGGHAYAITTFLDGVHLGPALDAASPGEAAELARAVGRTLGAIAGHAFPRPGLFDASLGFARTFASNAECYLDFMRWMIFEGRAGKRMGRDLARRVWRFVEANAGLLAPTEGRYGLVHGDYKLANLLVRRGPAGWAVSGVLDWEFASAGTPLFDAGILLRHEADLPPGFAARFAEGFVEGGGDLPPDWRRIARYLDLGNLCGFLNGSAHRERVFADVTRLIERTLADDQRP